uniref:Transporter associated with antigen processing, subunit type a n=1 Tax=Paramormyrops kingsleyae TaxID=1676925 RepID=A0A3B3Q8S8_9TELE
VQGDTDPVAYPRKQRARAAVCFDAALFYLLGCGAAPLLPVFGSNDVAGLLAFLWSAAAIRWGLICSLWLPTVDQTSRPVMRRWAAVHCFLGSVYESCRLAAFGGPLETGISPVGSPGFTFLTSIAAAAACMFWEVAFPDTNGEDNGKGKKQKARVLFMRVISFYKPDYLLLLGAFVFLSLAVLCEMFIPYYTGKVIDILGAQYHLHDFLTAIFFMGLFSIGSSLSSGCRGGLFMCAINGFTSRMKVKLFGSLVRQEIGFFESTKTGDITSRLSMDTTLMARTVALNVNVLLRTLIKTLGMLSLMFSLSWKLTVLMLMETPITGLLQNIHDTYYQRLSKEVQDSIARGNDAAGEAVAGIRTVRSFSAEQREATRYGDKLMDTHSLKTRRDTVRAVYLLLRRLTELGMQVAMLYYGRRFIQSGQMSTGNLVSFILYQTDLGQNIRTLIYMFGDMLNSVSAAGKVFEYLDRKPQVSTDGTLQPDTLTGHVQLCNLTFSYPTRPDEPALQGLSLELKPGQVTALVGPSGGGKTTCVSLLEGFYQPQGGEILLDGQPLHSYQHKYLHSKVAMVGQDPVLFSGSVRDNIAYGLKDCPLEVVQKAAQRANAHGFISQLEHGYDTGTQSVAEPGNFLWGGQDDYVIILGVATSEHAIQQALADRPSQTLLIIAHRLKTVERADQIILIDKGAVLERGTHQELMDKRGSYFRLREKIFTENGEQH